MSLIQNPPPILAGTEYNFSITENSTAIVPFTIEDGASPYDLTGNTLTLYLKATPTTADTSAFTDSVTVTAELLGKLTAVIPGVENIATQWYRIDAAAPTRSDSGCGVSLGSYTVTDASAVAADIGLPITSADIPVGTVITAVSAGVGYTISQEATANAGSQTFIVGGAITTLVFGTITILSV